MNDLILNTANEIGIFYVFYVVVLLLVNSLAKLIFDNEFTSKTKRIVIVFSIIIFCVFWLCGGKLRYLFLYTFFTFGFYDFIGRYIEKGLVLLLEYLDRKANHFKDWIKTLFNFKKQ